MKTIPTDVLIVGGGFAGLSTAYYLSERPGLRVTVIEREPKLGGHASGRNAGMIRQTVSDPVLAELASEGKRLLAAAQKKGWRLGLASQGSLLLAKQGQSRELERIRLSARRQGVASRYVSSREAARLVPALAEGDFDKALHCPSDALVDIEALLAAFLKALKARRVPVLCGSAPRAIRRTPRGFAVETPSGCFETKALVDAAGAWAPTVAAMAGASKLPFRAYRRHLFEDGRFRSAWAKWPFVWDLSHGFYFRPLRASLLLSPCDHTPFRAEGRSGAAEKTDPRMRQLLERKMGRFSPFFSTLEIRKEKAGLRTMAPYGRFVIGEDARLKNFYWVAGLGGHGVTTALSVGRLAADLVSGKRTASPLARALSPRRFQRSQRTHAAHAA